jgi:hypothetical protein
MLTTITERENKANRKSSRLRKKNLALSEIVDRLYCVDAIQQQQQRRDIMDKNLVAAIEKLNSALDNHFLVQPGTEFDRTAFAEHYGVNPFDLDEGDVHHCNDLSYPETSLLFTLLESDLTDEDGNAIGKYGVKTVDFNVNSDGTWYYAKAGDVGAAWNPETDELRTGEPYSTWA